MNKTTNDDLSPTAQRSLELAQSSNKADQEYVAHLPKVFKEIERASYENTAERRQAELEQAIALRKKAHQVEIEKSISCMQTSNSSRILSAPISNIIHRPSRRETVKPRRISLIKIVETQNNVSYDEQNKNVRQNENAKFNFTNINLTNACERNSRHDTANETSHDHELDLLKSISQCRNKHQVDSEMGGSVCIDQIESEVYCMADHLSAFLETYFENIHGELHGEKMLDAAHMAAQTTHDSVLANRQHFFTLLRALVLKIEGIIEFALQQVSERRQDDTSLMAVLDDTPEMIYGSKKAIHSLMLKVNAGNELASEMFDELEEHMKMRRMKESVDEKRLHVIEVEIDAVNKRVSRNFAETIEQLSAAHFMEQQILTEHMQRLQNLQVSFRESTQHVEDASKSSLTDGRVPTHTPPGMNSASLLIPVKHVETSLKASERQKLVEQVNILKAQTIKIQTQLSQSSNREKNLQYRIDELQILLGNNENPIGTDTKSRSAEHKHLAKASEAHSIITDKKMNESMIKEQHIAIENLKNQLATSESKSLSMNSKVLQLEDQNVLLEERIKVLSERVSIAEKSLQNKNVLNNSEGRSEKKQTQLDEFIQESSKTALEITQVNVNINQQHEKALLELRQQNQSSHLEILDLKRQIQEALALNSLCSCQRPAKVTMPDENCEEKSEAPEKIQVDAKQTAATTSSMLLTSIDDTTETTNEKMVLPQKPDMSTQLPQNEIGKTNADDQTSVTVRNTPAFVADTDTPAMREKATTHSATDASSLAREHGVLEKDKMRNIENIFYDDSEKSMPNNTLSYERAEDDSTLRVTKKSSAMNEHDGDEAFSSVRSAEHRYFQESASNDSSGKCDVANEIADRIQCDDKKVNHDESLTKSKQAELEHQNEMLRSNIEMLGEENKRLQTVITRETDTTRNSENNSQRDVQHSDNLESSDDAEAFDIAPYETADRTKLAEEVARSEVNRLKLKKTTKWRNDLQNSLVIARVKSSDISRKESTRKQSKSSNYLLLDTADKSSKDLRGYSRDENNKNVETVDGSLHEKSSMSDTTHNFLMADTIVSAQSRARKKQNLKIVGVRKTDSTVRETTATSRNTSDSMATPHKAATDQSYFTRRNSGQLKTSRSDTSKLNSSLSHENQALSNHTLTTTNERPESLEIVDIESMEQKCEKKAELLESRAGPSTPRDDDVKTSSTSRYQSRMAMNSRKADGKKFDSRNSKGQSLQESFIVVSLRNTSSVAAHDLLKNEATQSIISSKPDKKSSNCKILNAEPLQAGFPAFQTTNDVRNTASARNNRQRVSSRNVDSKKLQILQEAKPTSSGSYEVKAQQNHSVRQLTLANKQQRQSLTISNSNVFSSILKQGIRYSQSMAAQKSLQSPLNLSLFSSTKNRTPSTARRRENSSMNASLGTIMNEVGRSTSMSSLSNSSMRNKKLNTKNMGYQVDQLSQNECEDQKRHHLTQSKLKKPDAQTDSIEQVDPAPIFQHSNLNSKSFKTRRGHFEKNSKLGKLSTYTREAENANNDMNANTMRHAERNMKVVKENGTIHSQLASQMMSKYTAPRQQSVLEVRQLKNKVKSDLETKLFRFNNSQNFTSSSSVFKPSKSDLSTDILMDRSHTNMSTSASQNITNLFPMHKTVSSRLTKVDFANAKQSRMKNIQYQQISGPKAKNNHHMRSVSSQPQSLKLNHSTHRDLKSQSSFVSSPILSKTEVNILLKQVSALNHDLSAQNLSTNVEINATKPERKSVSLSPTNSAREPVTLDAQFPRSTIEWDLNMQQQLIGKADNRQSNLPMKSHCDDSSDRHVVFTPSSQPHNSSVHPKRLTRGTLHSALKQNALSTSVLEIPELGFHAKSNQRQHNLNTSRSFSRQHNSLPGPSDALSTTQSARCAYRNPKAKTLATHSILLNLSSLKSKVPVINSKHITGRAFHSMISGNSLTNEAQTNRAKRTSSQSKHRFNAAANLGGSFQLNREEKKSSRAGAKATDYRAGHHHDSTANQITSLRGLAFTHINNNSEL